MGVFPAAGASGHARTYALHVPILACKFHPRAWSLQDAGLALNLSGWWCGTSLSLTLSLSLSLSLLEQHTTAAHLSVDWAVAAVPCAPSVSLDFREAGQTAKSNIFPTHDRRPFSSKVDALNITVEPPSREHQWPRRLHWANALQCLQSHAKGRSRLGDHALSGAPS